MGRNEVAASRTISVSRGWSAAPKGKKAKKIASTPSPSPSERRPTSKKAAAPAKNKKIEFEVFGSPSPETIGIFEGKEWLSANGEQSGPSWVENPP